MNNDQSKSLTFNEWDAIKVDRPTVLLEKIDQPRRPTMAYSFVATKYNTAIAPPELTDELKIKQGQELREAVRLRKVLDSKNDTVVNVLSEKDIFNPGNVEDLIQILIEKDVDAWRALPENLRTFLMRSEKWKYVINEKTNLPNLIINDIELGWNGNDWVLKSFSM